MCLNMNVAYKQVVVLIFSYCSDSVKFHELRFASVDLKLLVLLTWISWIILQLLLQCAEQLPHKIPFYSVLVCWISCYVPLCNVLLFQDNLSFNILYDCHSTLFFCRILAYNSIFSFYSFFVSTYYESTCMVSSNFNLWKIIFSYS